MAARKHAHPGDVLNGNTVVRFSHERVEAGGRQVAHHYLFRCSCGKEFTANINYIRKGCTKGCGCARKLVKGINVTHNMSSTPTYKAWTSMRDRCLNPQCHSFPDYGGRGITICERWDNFENFLEDMGVKPAGTSLDRKEVNGHYCKQNCRWADASTQRVNQRPRIRNRDRFSAMDADVALLLAH